MKTTIDLPDVLFKQAKLHAQAQGVTLRTLMERGLRLAMLPREASQGSAWPDLSFDPDVGGTWLPAEHWRDAVNATPGWPEETAR